MVDPAKIVVILNLEALRSVKQLCATLGHTGYYRKFIKGFSQVCAPILETIREVNQPFQWTEAADRNFNSLKRKITEKPILALPDFEKVFQVETDASWEAIGVVLSQEQRPIAYFSDKLNDAKTGYSSYDKEFYAIVQTIKKWRHYLLPKEFILYSDNHAL